MSILIKLVYFAVMMHEALDLESAMVTSNLSSPRAKGLRAESARAVTGRWCPHSGEGEDFFDGSTKFFYGNSCNSGTESRKIISKVGN